MNLANVRYYWLLGDNSRFCFQAFALEQQATNAGVKSHGYKAKVEPLTTGSMGTAAVQSMPDGIREYMNEFYFNFQEY